MSRVWLLTHPEVAIDPAVPVTEWGLSPRGRARAEAVARQGWVRNLRHIASSAERKARDTAEGLSAATGLPVRVLHELGENDRSATGYLPPPAFEAMADAFFARPEESVRGWERAADAQARMVAAVERVLAESEGATAIVAHGAVGALLLCHLQGWPIGRGADQPGRGGGNLYVFEKDSRKVTQGWTAFEHNEQE
ncbi:histidine phosphatase family protein [Pseudoroseomonas rhizosphaerae]|uniref:Histidine phosphatase family protein n=1 Tax=Teichococcus rhizosphaerae TaxID=1335062 RepID=A0A2C7A7K6_9PROT|nr:histidine phosphatase family protein [Pseudoroseomonas rhizosphaerae]PHK93969.1 histidine phosphatase family protein [Pseudoroseomonas rhizosphaerae]